MIGGGCGAIEVSVNTSHHIPFAYSSFIRYLTLPQYATITSKLPASQANLSKTGKANGLFIYISIAVHFLYAFYNLAI